MTQSLLITGSAKGLGRALALHLAGPGKKLFLHYNTSGQEAARLAGLVEAKGAQAVTLQADLAKADERAALLERLAGQTSRLHLLVNNVGVYHPIPLERITPQDFSRTLEATLTASFHLIQGCLPLLEAAAPAQVINMGDALAGQLAARPTATDYYIAKSGLLTLSRTFAQLLAPRAIRVNTVSPGIMENTIHGHNLPVPSGRLATFSDILATIDFLLSPASGYLTGTDIPVAGGWGL